MRLAPQSSDNLLRFCFFCYRDTSARPQARQCREMRRCKNEFRLGYTMSLDTYRHNVECLRRSEQRGWIDDRRAALVIRKKAQRNRCPESGVGFGWIHLLLVAN